MYLPSHVFSQSSCTRHKDAFRKVCWPCGQHVLLCQLLRTTNASWCQAEILPSCITDWQLHFVCAAVYVTVECHVATQLQGACQAACSRSLRPPCISYCA
jgi:hypothetical protein